MNYELLSELKDNGWKFNVRIEQGVKIDSKWYLTPTLSELIEACGKYVVLKQENLGWTAYHNNVSFNDCVGFDAIDVFMIDSESGDTPKEAVSRLWLKINKK